MTYTLFLDDERHPVDETNIVVRSFEEAVDYVRANGTPKHVCFDHDLGELRNGYHFALWLTDWNMDGNGFPESYSVHSQNPVGADNIRGIMDGYMDFIE
ncbi:cyclic-phosphate processing receiver domain-containing protein [Mycobacterium kansasii]